VADLVWSGIPNLPPAQDVGTMNGDTQPHAGNMNWWTRAYCVATEPRSE
jgi:hypothetical protein